MYLISSCLQIVNAILVIIKLLSIENLMSNRTYLPLETPSVALACSQNPVVPRLLGLTPEEIHRKLLVEYRIRNMKHLIKLQI